jgi:transcription initiation factor TFIID subunit 2
LATPEAVYALERFPTASTRAALTHTIENEQAYYKVRCKATHCLTKVANNMAASWDGPPAMLVIFKRMFGSFAANNIIKQNDFSNLQNYFLQCHIPVAMAGLRNAHQICPPEVLSFLLDLFKYNDNSKNTFSDNYYREALVKALGETVTPVVSRMLQTEAHSSDSMTEDTRRVLEEITRYLNLEKLLPCYRNTVTTACLHAIRKLQKTSHLPPNPELFRDYAKYGQFHDVRLAAIECLVDYVRLEGRQDDLGFLLDLVERDPVPDIRHRTVRMLIKTPPFEKGRHHRNDTHRLVERLWGLIDGGFWYDSRLRCDMVDLYYTLYGRKRPPSLPLPELAALGRPGTAWSGKKEKGGGFTIPRGEKRERVEEQVVVKQEPVEPPPDPTMAGVVIKQEVDERAEAIAGKMEVPDYLQGDMVDVKHKKHKKEKKKKKKHKHRKEELGDRDLSQDSRSQENSR